MCFPATLRAFAADELTLQVQPCRNSQMTMLSTDKPVAAPTDDVAAEGIT
jgi:hypothetical protein